MLNYTPLAWYWSGPLGVFSSASKTIVPATDATYETWLAAGNIATAWPKDATGAQTAAALDAVLAPYGISTGLSQMTPAQLLAYASNAQNAALAQVFSFNVAAAGATAHWVTTKLDDAGSASVIKIGVWAIMNAGAAPEPMPYSNVDFSSTTLTVAEAGSLAAQAGAVEIASYAVLNGLEAGINATPPPITATAQIDAASWPAHS